MATSLNKIMLIGNLGRDPELRHAGDRPVAEFSLATTERWRDQSGAEKSNTDWHRIVVWGRSGENCAKYLSKGSMVYVEGSMRYRDWTDKDGNKRTTAEVVASSVQFLDRAGDRRGGDGGGGGGGGGYDRSESSSSSRGGGNSAPPANDGFDDDDIPF